jgi:transposase
VTAIKIDHQSAADGPQLPELVNRTAQGFKVGEMSADKAYLSASNFDAVESHGGKFFPAFKVNSTGSAGGSFEKAFHYFSFKRDEYLAHYHQRSNVESTVSMVKRKFGDAVKAKNDTAQKNEVYAKFVCHNLRVLIAETYAMRLQAMLDNRRGRAEWHGRLNYDALTG